MPCASLRAGARCGAALFVSADLCPPGGVRRDQLTGGVGLRFLVRFCDLPGFSLCRVVASHAGVSAPAAVIKDALCHMPGKSVHLRCVILGSGVNSGSLREGENSSISYRFLTQTKAPTTRRCPS